MTEPTNSDIMFELGKLTSAAAQQLIESSRANESRRVLYDKIEETNSVVQSIKSEQQEQSFLLRATTDIAVQARDGLQAFRAKYEKEAAPILEGVETFRQEVEPLLAATRAVKNWTAVFAVLTGAGIISVGTIFAFFNEAAKAAIRTWLGI